MTRKSLIVSAVLISLAFVGSSLAYGSLPERVPTHWNLQGKADGFGPKLMAAFLLPTVLVGLLGLFAALPRISPSQFTMDGFRSTYGTIVTIVLAMLAFVHTVALLAAMGYPIDVTKAIAAGTLLGLGLMGNFFGKLRRNFFVGVRVPWTLASERVWNETHRLAAWVTSGGGLLGAAVALAGYPLVALSVIVPIAAVPILFSLFRYKQLEARGEI